MRLTFGPSIFVDNDLHIDIVRQNLTLQLPALMPEVRAEIDFAWQDAVQIGNGMCDSRQLSGFLDREESDYS